MSGYKYERELLIQEIEDDGFITSDGYYFAKNFFKKNLEVGEISDNEYIYERGKFAGKIVFTLSDMDAYLSKDSIYDIAMMQERDSFINGVVKDAYMFNFKDLLFINKFTSLEGLIDDAMYLFNNGFNK
jgi:hypothetical protein